MKSFRGVACGVALVGVSAGMALAQGRPIAPQPVEESASLSKRGYDYYAAQGDVGSARLRTKSGDVFAWASVRVAREASSGMSTGKRMHKPFVITKEIDASSPKLAAMAASHGAIPELTVTLDGASKDAAKSASSGAGAGKAVFQDLSIVSIRKVSATMEEITMSYERISVTNTRGGVMAEDDWSTK